MTCPVNQSSVTTLIIIPVFTQVLTACIGTTFTGLLAHLQVRVCLRGMPAERVSCLSCKPGLSACRYVQQDDILPGTSTVWEYLRFHAKLRMGAFSSQSIEQQAWSVIQLLGLSKVGTCGRQAVYFAQYILNGLGLRMLPKQGGL